MTVPSGPVTSVGEVGQSSDSTRLLLVRECSLSEGEGGGRGEGRKMEKRKDKG